MLHCPLYIYCHLYMNIEGNNIFFLPQSVEGATSSLQRLVLGAGARRATLPRSAPELDNLRDHIAEVWFYTGCSEIV